MQRNEILKRITELIIENLGVEDEKVTPDARIGHDLGADSLDGVELIMAAEAAFGIELADSAEGDLKNATVNQAVDYIAAALYSKAVSK